MSDDDSLMQEPGGAETHAEQWAAVPRAAAAPAHAGTTGGQLAHWLSSVALLACAALPLLGVVGLAGLLYYASWLAASRVRLEDVPCETAGCQRLARFLEASINQSADACDDFYGYVCSNQMYENTFKKMRRQQMANLTRTLRASPVPAQRQSALQKMTALFCSCVSLVSENRSESAELWAFLDKHGLQPRPVGGKRATGRDQPDPLESMVYLSVTYGLQPVVAFSSHGDSDQNRYHHLDISHGYNVWQVTRQNMSESNDLSSFVVQRMSVLVPPLDRDAVLELSTDIIFTESQVVVFLVQVNKSLEETKQISSFWTQIKHLGDYSRDAVSSQRWLSAIRHGAHPSSAAEDSVYARPLALALLTRLLSDRGGVETARRLMWWGLVRELAPYASGRYLPKDPEKLNRFCVARVASVSRLAIMAVHLFRAVTPSVLSSAESMADHVQAALVESLRSSPWLRDGPTRNTALLKAASMALSVGFPAGLSRESELDAYFAPLRDLRADRSLSSWLALRRFLQRRKGPADDAAATHAHKVNAYYLSDNRVMVPAGIIQEPVYFHGAADAYNYGSLGQAMGHEMMHAYDTSGRKLDHRGKSWDWWSGASRRGYEERLRCIRRSHAKVEGDTMTFESGLRQDPENLGDFSGARLAYEAFQSLPDRSRALSVAGFGSERLFFIGHCVKWCRSLAEHRNLGYARGRSRCIVPLMHMPEFSEAFGCGEEAYMNPKRKCSFW